MNKLLIKAIPKEERPRERLIRDGAKNISLEDLIAITLKTGTKDYSSKYLAGKILSLVKDASELKNLTLKKLISINGIGAVKAIDFLAALELGRRVYQETVIDSSFKCNGAVKVFNYFKHLFIFEKQEYFYCLYLDNHKNLIDKKLLFKGTINRSIVHPREIFKEAYLNSASSIICIHNHPSGVISPSKEDILITKKLVSIGKLLGIPIIDHIIIGKDDYYSFYENDILEE